MSTKGTVDWIPLTECRKGWLYRLHSRNLRIGVFDGAGDKPGFIGIRTKFGSRFLDTEYHWDTYAEDWPFATAKPIRRLEKLPDDIPISECGDSSRLFSWLDEMEQRYEE